MIGKDNKVSDGYFISTVFALFLLFGLCLIFYVFLIFNAPNYIYDVTEIENNTYQALVIIFFKEKVYDDLILYCNITKSDIYLYKDVNNNKEEEQIKFHCNDNNFIDKIIKNEENKSTDILLLVILTIICLILFVLTLFCYKSIDLPDNNDNRMYKNYETYMVHLLPLSYC